MSQLRCSLAGSLRNAVRCIRAMEKEIGEERLEKLELQPGYHRFVLGEIAGHAEETRKGKHAVDDFARHYCLRELTEGEGHE